MGRTAYGVKWNDYDDDSYDDDNDYGNNYYNLRFAEVRTTWPCDSQRTIK